MTGKRTNQRIAFWIFRILGLIVVGILFWILGFIIWHGAGVINWKFLTTAPTDGMTDGGIPSIIFGLFGMALFVNALGFGDSIIAGSFTLGLLALPLVIRTTEEALKAVPDSYRTGSLALGATKLQTIWRVVLPTAFPNITTGLILSIGRVSGETAPILFTAAAYFLPKLPTSIYDQVMALPYHLYVIATSGTDLEATRPMAYGTALVLIVIVLAMNLLASFLRRHFGKKVKTN